jgi:hypothetical protein
MFNKQVRGKASPGRLGGHGSLANKRAADVRARALASTLREIQAVGFISRRALADELNRRGVPTARGGRWHRTTVERMLKRLGQLTWGVGARINNGQAKKHSADGRAKVLAPTIAKLQKAGFVSISAIMRELRKQRDSNRPRWQMAPDGREATAAAPGKAKASAPQLGPFFCPWNRFSPRPVGG